MKSSTRSYYADIVARAVRRVRANLDGAVDLAGLAREAALAPLHFHRIFRGMVGETPLELHRRLRLERAAVQLAHGGASITTVAFDAGYETHEAFTRSFRRAFAMSPSEFRESQERARTGCERPHSCELAARSGIHYARELFAFQQPGEPTMNVRIDQVAELRLATVPHIGPYDQISRAFAQLGAIAGSAGLFRVGAKMIAIYHDDPDSTPAAELRSDAAISIGPRETLPVGLAEATIPAGRYAMTVHHGSYATLGDTWARLMGEWLPQSGNRLGAAGAAFEVYRNTPESVPEDQLETELYMPLA